jgi:hypothetical protein
VFYRSNIAFKLKIVCSDIKVYPKLPKSVPLGARNWISDKLICEYVYSLPWSMGTQTFILKFVLLSLWTWNHCNVAHEIVGIFKKRNTIYRKYQTNSDEDDVDSFSGLSIFDCPFGFNLFSFKVYSVIPT